MTHTYAVLDVPAAVYAAVRSLLAAAHYQHAFHAEKDGEVIDMHGIALRSKGGSANTDITVGTLLSSRTKQGRVELSVNGELTQMDLDKAREIVGMLQQAMTRSPRPSGRRRTRDAVMPTTTRTDRPKRIQRKRTRGWRMPEGAVYVGRLTRWGNPWTPDGYWDAGYSGSLRVAVEACVDEYRGWLTRTRSRWSGHVPDERIHYPGDPKGSVRTPPDVSALRGKDLACWCPLDQPCHADVLLEMANAD